MDYEYYYTFPDETENEILDELRREQDEIDDVINERGRFAPTYDELYARMSDMLDYTPTVKYAARIRRYLKPRPARRR